MSPALRQALGILILIACIAAAVFVVARGGNPSAGIGAAIGIVVVLIISNRARNRNSR